MQVYRISMLKQSTDLPTLPSQKYEESECSCCCIMTSPSHSQKRCDAIRPMCGPCGRPYQRLQRRDPCTYSEDSDSDHFPDARAGSPNLNLTHEIPSFGEPMPTKESYTFAKIIPATFPSNLIEVRSLTDFLFRGFRSPIPTLTMEDANDPLKFALSSVALDDLNLSL